MAHLGLIRVDTLTFSVQLMTLFHFTFDQIFK